MYFLLGTIVALILLVMVVMRSQTFGAKPSGYRLERIKKSKNYKDGKFRNFSDTPPLTNGHTYLSVSYQFFFGKKEGLFPDVIPAVKTNLKALNREADLLVWFGHSSYMLQLDGRKFLIDPVFSGYASPFRWMNKAFNGSDAFQADDFPYIDYLVITHDHYDHLDYDTVMKLSDKVGKVICPLGVGAHFERWGFAADRLIEGDWDDKVFLKSGMVLHFCPARHFSGRSVYSNNTLWTSYVIGSHTKKIFIGGDSGYDTHFSRLGNMYKGFDLAILDNGQYSDAWRLIHTHPEEVLKAGMDLQAKRIFPVHAGKFNLGGHAWDAPYAAITALNKEYNQALITPLIGEVVYLDNDGQEFSKWWLDETVSDTKRYEFERDVI